MSAPAYEAGAMRPSRSRAYASARRHSGWVRALKIAIPVGAALALLGVVAATFYNPLSAFGDLTLGPLSVSGTKVAMENPRLTGYRKDARPYEVDAKAAYQDIRKPNVIELKDMRAKLALEQGGASAQLLSAAGLFDTQKELLELNEAITVTTDRGERADLRSATVDMKAGTVVTRDPVKITTPTAVVEADGMQISDNGRTAAFTGRVRTQFLRITNAPGATAEAPAKLDPAPSPVSRVEPARPKP